VAAPFQPDICEGNDVAWSGVVEEFDREQLNEEGTLLEILRRLN
jgi:hypothetical protein